MVNRHTALKIRTYRTQNLNKKAFYILFDTLVIDKKYRNKKLSNLLMIFNNTVISQSGYFAFLMCKKELVNFYKKNKWVKLNNKTFKVVDHLHYTCGMVFNMKKITKKNYFYINR